MEESPTRETRDLSAVRRLLTREELLAFETLAKATAAEIGSDSWTDVPLAVAWAITIATCRQAPLETGGSWETRIPKAEARLLLEPSDSPPTAVRDRIRRWRRLLG